VDRSPGYDPHRKTPYDGATRSTCSPRCAPLANERRETVGKDNDDKESDLEDDKDDDGGRHRGEDNTDDARRDRPMPPPPDPNKHDR
jgi:hypothetical protein